MFGGAALAGEDLWSIGVITYILLCGYPPFYGGNDVEILASVKTAKYDFPSPEWDTVSKEAKAFVRAHLMVDPSKRPTAAEVSPQVGSFQGGVRREIFGWVRRRRGIGTIGGLLEHKPCTLP